MFIHPQTQKDRQTALQHAAWLSRHLLISIFPYQNVAGKVFCYGGYNLIHTATYSPAHKYPYPAVLDWAPYPSYDGSRTNGFLPPLVVGSTLRWQATRSRLTDKMTLLVAMRPWAQADTDFNPSVDPIPHLRLSTPHLSIKCRNGIANPFFVEVGGTTINLPTLRTFCWLIISINQSQLDLQLLASNGQSFTYSTTLASPIATPANTYIEVNYEKLAGYSDTFDPRHTDHLVGQVHLFDRAFPTRVLRDMLLNQHTMRGWVHPNNRSAVLFFYPTINSKLRATANTEGRVLIATPRALLNGFVSHESKLFTTLSDTSSILGFAEHFAKDLGSVAARGLLPAFSETTATPFYGTSLAGFTSLTAQAENSALLLHGASKASILLLVDKDAAWARVLNPGRMRNSFLVFHEAKLPSKIYNVTHGNSIVFHIARAPTRNPLNGHLNSYLILKATARAESSRRLLGSILARLPVITVSQGEAKVVLKSILRTGTKPFTLLRGRAQQNPRIVIFANSFAEDEATIALAGRIRGTIKPQVLIPRGIIRTFDRIFTSTRSVVIVFVSGELVVEDDLPAFGSNTPKHILDL